MSCIRYDNDRFQENCAEVVTLTMTFQGAIDDQRRWAVHCNHKRWCTSICICLYSYLHMYVFVFFLCSVVIVFQHLYLFVFANLPNLKMGLLSTGDSTDQQWQCLIAVDKCTYMSGVCYYWLQEVYKKHTTLALLVCFWTREAHTSPSLSESPG